MNTPVPSGTASLTDLLTAVKNLVTQLSNATQTQLNIYGAASTENITAATWIAAKNRLCRVSIVSPGGASGTIYDAKSVTDTSRPIWTIPAALGMVEVGIPVTYGILVAPGSGQNVTVTWS